jgi:hypothetical protein
VPALTFAATAFRSGELKSYPENVLKGFVILNFQLDRFPIDIEFQTCGHIASCNRDGNRTISFSRIYTKDATHVWPARLRSRFCPV